MSGSKRSDAMVAVQIRRHRPGEFEMQAAVVLPLACSVVHGNHAPQPFHDDEFGLVNEDDRSGDASGRQHQCRNPEGAAPHGTIVASILE